MGMPMMLREIVRQAATAEPGIDIAAELEGSLDDLTDVMAIRPDVVVVCAEQVSEIEVDRLLQQCNGVRVVGLSADASQATLYEMRPYRARLGELGTAGLIAVIRAPVGEI
jgi:hypothetical protein